MRLIPYLKSIMPLDSEAEAAVREAFEYWELKRKTVLYEAGHYVNFLYFVESGLARMHYLNALGKEITYGFYGEDNFVTTPESFFKRQPGNYSLELIEDTALQRVSYDRFEQLMRDFPEFGLVENYVLKHFVFRAADRIVALQFQTAEERYQTLMEQQPSIIQRAALGHIASYLGITQETLSRIRARR